MINFTKRCMSMANLHMDGLAYRVIRYGQSANEANQGLEYQKWRDVPNVNREPTYEEKRRAAERERQREKVYIQSYRNPLDVGTLNQARSASGIEIIKDIERRAWSDYTDKGLGE